MEIFSVKELSDYLKCSISCIRKLVRDKTIPFFRLGYKINFDKKSIDNWVSQQEQNNIKQLYL